MERPLQHRSMTLKLVVVVTLKFFVVAAFSALPGLGAHQISNVEKRRHELGAQGNDLFEELQATLRQQEDEIAACRATLAELRQDQANGGSVAAVCLDPVRTSDAELPPPVSDELKHTDQIATVTRATSSSRGIGGAAEAEINKLRTETEAADFANYFSSYAELDHQKQMLEDERRMEAYRDSMLNNAEFFAGKTVLDVGSGSGVLAIFAAQAGAKKVYAVEYTDMAKHARTMVEKNGFTDVIQVIQDSAESLILPEKVDIIVSEWMGYFLLRESMLDSVVVARDNWLKEDGVMFPSHASMVWAAVDDGDEKMRKDGQYASSLESWASFSEQAMSKYALDMSGLDEAYDAECVEYFTLSSAWRELTRTQVITNPIVVKELDLHTCTLDETKGLSAVPFSFKLRRGAPQATGFAGWFDVSFRGRDGVSPLSVPVEFSTSPTKGYTHWGQQVFYLQEAVPAQSGAPMLLEGEVSMVRQARNPRLYNVKVNYRVTSRAGEDGGEGEVESAASHVYKLS